MADAKFEQALVDKIGTIKVQGANPPDVFIDKVLELSSGWKKYMSSNKQMDEYANCLRVVFNRYILSRQKYFSDRNDNSGLIDCTEFAQVFEASVNNMRFKPLGNIQITLMALRDAQKYRNENHRNNFE